MQWLPKVKIERFAQLAPGDLFVHMHGGESCLALKAVDQHDGGDRLILTLGPKFPTRTSGPRLLTWGAGTTVSFGKDYIIQLPTAPDGWSDEVPAPEVFCLAVTTSAVYFRGNHHPDLQGFNPCMVKSDDGTVSYGRLPDHAAYALRWEIVVKDAGSPMRTLLQHPVA